MRILISSKQLATELNKINFEEEDVFQVRGEGSDLIICTNKQNIEIQCEILEFEPRILQEDRRWDWVKNLVNAIDEQPIVLDIHENAINVIFHY